MQLLYKVTILTILSCMLSGCSHQQQISMTIISAHDINKDIHGIDKPIPVTLFELTRPLPFKKLSYSSLTENPESALNNTLFDYQSLEIKPRRKIQQTILLDPMTRYFAVIAGYRDIDKHNWKSITYIPPKKTDTRIIYYIESNNLYTQLDKGF